MAFDILEALQARGGPHALSTSAVTDLARALFRAEGIGFFLLDVAKAELHVDSVILGILGRTEDTFDPSVPWTDYVHPEDLIELNRRSEAEGHIPLEVVSYRLVRPNGEVRHVEAATVFQTDAAGLPTHVVGINRDVTQEATLAEQAARSEKRLADVISNLDAGVYQYTLGPSDAGQIDFLSAGCERIWELPPGGEHNDPAEVLSHVHPDDIEPLGDSLRRSAETLEDWRFEYRYRGPSGAERWLEGRGTPTRLGDGRTRWNSLVLDITEAKRLQQELARKDRMLAESLKHEAIGRITGGVAHDFNNLLAIIMGNAELITLSDPGAPITEEVDQIQLASSKGKDLVSSLLTFAGRAVLQTSEIDPVASVRECIRLVERTLGDNIAVELEADAGIWRCVADRSLFENSILNLCINARDALPQGGLLSIRLSNHACEDTATDLGPGQYVRVQVVDDGAGIPPDAIDRVTEPFFTTKEPGAGSGLGLSMVDGFARQSGGAFRIRSVVERGTTAELFLPATGALEADGEATRAEPTSAVVGVRSAVLVEDDEAVAHVFSKFLSTLGFEVEQFTTAQAALDHLDESGSPDIVVSDVDLPGRLSGIDLAERLLAADAAARVILVSGHPRSSLQRANALSERALFLAKPLQRSDLAEAIRKLS